MSCGAGTVANGLLTDLTSGKNFDLPPVDLNQNQFQIPEQNGQLYADVSELKTTDLTTGSDGTGVFDVLMTSVGSHLRKEYDASRITGKDYTEAFTAIMANALNTATSFLLGKDQAFWQALIAQQQARTAEIQTVIARVQLETAKAELMRARLMSFTAEAEYAITKLRLATEDQNYCLLLAQTEQAQYQVDYILPAQYAGLTLDNDAKEFTNSNILPNQEKLLKEQVEVQRAQTMNNRSDGATVAGSIGKQKDLYTQQIDSYKRDAEVKAAKLFTDAWITMKTMDEGLLPPSNFENSSLNGILADIKTANNIG